MIKKTKISIKDCLLFLKSKNITFEFKGDQSKFVSGLSHLENPDPNMIVYSENREVKLKDNIVISNIKNNSNTIYCENPKLAFYYLSEFFYKNELVSNSNNINYSKSIIVGNNCTIGDCKIGENVIIGHNTVIEDGVEIGDNTIIGNNCSIGCFGLSWTWDNDEKVFLYAVGKTIIGSNCKISSNVKIVRGVFSKSTILGDNVFIAPGSAVGHGAYIKDNVHIANNCAIGGSAIINENVFMGCSSTVSTYAVIGENTILASACCVKSNQELEDNSVYIGIPAKKIKSIEKKYSVRGVPNKNKVSSI